MTGSEMQSQDVQSPDMEPESPHQQLFSQFESLIQQISPHQASFETLAHDLRQNLNQLTQLAPFDCNSVKMHIYELGYNLWQACAKAFVHPLFSDETRANLHQISADLSFLSAGVVGVSDVDVGFRLSRFYQGTGRLWHNIGKFDLAASCFQKASDLVSNLDVGNISESWVRIHLLDLKLNRARVAWEVGNYEEIHKELRTLLIDCDCGRDTIQHNYFFADISRDFAKQCMRDEKYQMAAKFYDLVLEFFCISDNYHFDRMISEFGVVSDHELSFLCESLILKVASMTSSERETKTMLTLNELMQAVDLLYKAAKILQSSSQQLGVDATTFPFAKYAVSTYNIFSRLNSKSPQLESNREVAISALNPHLSSLISSSSPDYQHISLIFKALITIKGYSDDDFVYKLFQQAYQLVVRLEAGEYPIIGVQWLYCAAEKRARVLGMNGEMDMSTRWTNMGDDLISLVWELTGKGKRTKRGQKSHRRRRAASKRQKKK